MPLTAKGSEILENMEKTYGSPEKAQQVLYASKNAGTISGIDTITSAGQEEQAVSAYTNANEYKRDPLPPATDAAVCGMDAINQHIQIHDAEALSPTPDYTKGME